MNGKGDRRRPPTVSNTQFDENWDKAFSNQQKGDMLREVAYDGMWQHSCTVDMSVVWIGKNETCDYCGAWEEDGN
jgi:hypothetical protein